MGEGLLRAWGAGETREPRVPGSPGSPGSPVDNTALSSAVAVNNWLLMDRGSTPLPPLEDPPLPVEETRAQLLRQALLSVWEGRDPDVEESIAPSQGENPMQSLMDSWHATKDSWHASKDSWHATKDSCHATKDVKSTTGTTTPSHAETLRQSLMNSWHEDEVAEPLEEKEEAVTEPPKPSVVEELRMSLLNIGKDDTKGDQSDWVRVSEDRSESDEASIVTLDTLTDISEDYDDFSDMKHHLNQWISKY